MKNEKGSGRRLLIIGAGWEQVPLLQRARDYGCTIVAAATDPQAEGLSLADIVEIADPRDLPRLVEIAERHGVDAVTADECDYSNYAAMVIRRVKGWRSGPISAVQFTTNKHWMRQRCKQAHIVQPRFAACRSMDEVKAAVELIDFPVIVKPVDNRGSFGVRRVDSDAELEPAFLHALMNAHSREVLVEAYIDGIHLTVDGCVDSNGIHHNLGIASKEVATGDKPIITEVVYPAEISADLCSLVLDTNSKVIHSLGISRGITHSEYILDDRGRCFLLETANRGGGVMTSTLILPAITGVDIPDVLIREALDMPFAIQPLSEPRAALLGFLVFRPGRIASITGVDDVRSFPGVLHLRMLVKPGDALVSPQSGAGRHGFGIFVGNSVAEVRELHRRVVDCIEVVYA